MILKITQHYFQSLKHTHTQTHTDTQTHRHTHTHTRRHTHTHTHSWRPRGEGKVLYYFVGKMENGEKTLNNLFPGPTGMSLGNRLVLCDQTLKSSHLEAPESCPSTRTEKASGTHYPVHWFQGASDPAPAIPHLCESSSTFKPI